MKDAVKFTFIITGMLCRGRACPSLEERSGLAARIGHRIRGPGALEGQLHSHRRAGDPAAPIDRSRFWNQRELAAPADLDGRRGGQRGGKRRRSEFRAADGGHPWIVSVQPTTPSVRHRRKARLISQIRKRRAGVVVRHTPPRIARIVGQVAVETPCGEHVGVAARRKDMLGSDPVVRQRGDVVCVQLHGAKVIGSIGVGHPQASPTIFNRRHGQHDVRRHLEALRRRQGAGQPL